MARQKKTLRRLHGAAVLLELWTEALLVSMEAQMVISMRLAGMMGFWNVTHNERRLMHSEKVLAVQASATAVATAFVLGVSPAGIALAAVKPLRAKTSANLKRLSKRGAGRQTAAQGK